ncbi:ATPase family 2 protein [Lachnellula suecica]|uniref:ATPase family 2 protein n=1 Tax=Lachnellula suecica TaxID=602035 RepID=A0A8T9C2L9_9HELO|nr:ATPase family 2 protein [Lachnellula suecica]
MTNTTLKVRPWPVGMQERPDQKCISRVYLSNDAIRSLGLQNTKPCYIWKAGTEGQRREAIVWLSPSEKTINKDVIQISKTFQGVCSLTLTDEVNICAAGPALESVESLTLRDITPDLGVDPKVGYMKDRDLAPWEWFLEENLKRAEVVFGGMIFKDISLRGSKRTFVATAVNGRPTGQGTFDVSTSSVKILSQDDSQLNGSQPRLEIINLAGIDQALKQLNTFLAIFDRGLQISASEKSCGVLLHGGLGSGKTHVINKIVETGWGKVHKIDFKVKSTEIPKVFRDAKLYQPSIIVIDDLEDLVSKEDSVSKLMTNVIGEELDNLVKGCEHDALPRVLVIAATSDILKIPSSLRTRGDFQSGRFQSNIFLSIPDAASRKAILRAHDLDFGPEISLESRDEIFEKLGDRTHAYTPRDLIALLGKACYLAEERTLTTDEDPPYFVKPEEIEQAFLKIRPTALHDITLKPRKVRWDEIGGQESVKEALRDAVDLDLEDPEIMEGSGEAITKGILLYGPPGCSKTLNAQALATEVDHNFFAVKGAEMLNMYVGESEKAVREIFERARNAKPSIIFFDEFDSIAGARQSGNRGSGVNIVTTLLNELDGIESLEDVLVLAATNRPEALDPAVLRPGRFDKLIYVPPPDTAGREAILRVRLRNLDTAEDVDITELARLTDGYSGAEITGICHHASQAIKKKRKKAGLKVPFHMSDFQEAIKGMKKRVTPDMVQAYERWAAGIVGNTD